MKASVAKIDLGFIVIDGLMLPDGGYGVAVPQIGDLFPQTLAASLANGHLSRAVKTILGKESSLAIATTEYTKAKVSILTLEQLWLVARKLDKQGSSEAAAFIDAAGGETLERRFDKAFNVIRTEDERNARFKARYDAAKSFHPHFTQWLLKDAGGDRNMVNWGGEVNRLKNTLGLPLVNVDTYDEIQLRRLKDCEVMYHGMRIGGLNHETAMTCLRAV